jgi:hypothetical protein
MGNDNSPMAFKETVVQSDSNHFTTPMDPDREPEVP